MEAEGERRTDEVDLRDQRSSSAALVAPATPMPELPGPDSLTRRIGRPVRTT